MFYISSLREDLSNRKYGVTDTSDNVEEFYTMFELLEILNKIGFTSIAGLVYTGSDLKATVVTLDYYLASNLGVGEKFYLTLDSDKVEYTLVNYLGNRGITVEGDGKRLNLTRSWFILNKDRIKVELKEG